jgi:hypothetical protein
MDPIHDPQWSRLTPEQQRLHLAIAKRYRALGGRAFHLPLTHSPPVGIPLPNGKREFFNPMDLVLNLERLRQEGLIDRSNQSGVYTVQPTQAGIAMAEAVRDGQFGLTARSSPAGSHPSRDQQSRRESNSRRNSRYLIIDEALREIALAQPNSHEEVFRILENRRIAFPKPGLFQKAGGWRKGFERDGMGARAWLSKRWGILKLPPFPRGPK